MSEAKCAKAETSDDLHVFPSLVLGFQRLEPIEDIHPFGLLMTNTMHKKLGFNTDG